MYQGEYEFKKGVFYPTRFLLDHKPFRRNLDLQEQVLTNNDLSPETINDLRQGTEKQRKQELRKAVGPNLQGRDLRHANLYKSILPKADLRKQERTGTLANLQGANLSEAQLQGAGLRQAAIGGARFKDAMLDLTDLRGLDRSPFSQDTYQEPSEDLAKSVDDPELRKRILAGLEANIGKEDSLNEAKSFSQCLSDAPNPPQGCLTEKDEVKYRRTLGDYLVKQLACTDAAIANRIAHRSIPSIFWPGDSNLAATLLNETCPAVKTAIGKLSGDGKQRLEQLAKDKKL